VSSSNSLKDTVEAVAGDEEVMMLPSMTIG
jgi:hypothetical protein